MLTDTGKLYASLLERLSRAVPFNSGSIQVLEDDATRIVAFRGGLDPEIVMNLRFPMDPLYPNYRVVTTRKPVSFPDIRVEYPHFLTRQEEFGSGHIRSWLGVPMIVSGATIGMIALDRNVVDPFRADDIRIVQGFADHAAVAIQNSVIYRKLQEALAAKDRLLRELNHRVKNNLQLVSSFISIHSDLVRGEDSRAILEQLRLRIESIAAAHKRMYRQADPGAGVEMVPYLRDVSEDFWSSFMGPDSPVSLRMDLEDMTADMGTAVPLGLILNELLTNAMKYAFPGTTGGTISVGLHREGAGGVLQVEDTGIGIPADPSRPDGGFGMQLVRGLAEQLGGGAELDSRTGRTAWTIRFPGS